MPRIACRTSLLLAAVAASGMVAAAQQRGGPTFEVATVKPMKGGDAQNRISIQPGGRLTFSNITLKQLIGTSYQRWAFDSREIIGGPDWIDSDRFEVLALGKGDLADPDGFPGPAFAMIRNLLSDRFHLQVHEEKRERQVYALQVARADKTAGSGLRRSTIDCAAIMRDEANGKPPKSDPGLPRPCSVGALPGRLRTSGVTMDALASVLSAFVGRPVVNRTGLEGGFDLDIDFSAEFRPGFVAPEPGAVPPAPSDKPSLFTALQEQLGLRLTGDRAPVDVLVIDHAEPPTPD